LAPTKHKRRKNIGADRNVHVDRNYWRRRNTRVEILVSTKISRQQNSRVDKNLASTKFSRRPKPCVDKMRRRRRISVVFGSAESTAADFSQTSLMISYVSQKVLIPSHAVAKCGIASGCPSFMGGLSPALYQLVVLARHAEKRHQYWRRQDILACQDFTDFRHTIVVYISAHRRPAKNW
jgi:hypothetical protein